MCTAVEILLSFFFENLRFVFLLVWKTSLYIQTFKHLWLKQKTSFSRYRGGYTISQMQSWETWRACCSITSLTGKHCNHCQPSARGWMVLRCGSACQSEREDERWWGTPTVGQTPLKDGERLSFKVDRSHRHIVLKIPDTRTGGF